MDYSINELFERVSVQGNTQNLVGTCSKLKQIINTGTALFHDITLASQVGEAYYLNADDIIALSEFHAVNARLCDALENVESRGEFHLALEGASQ